MYDIRARPQGGFIILQNGVFVATAASRAEAERIIAAIEAEE